MEVPRHPPEPDRLAVLRSPIRGYAWGSRTAIAAIQGRPVPSPGPEAELWVGAHPAGSSVLDRTGRRLADAIERAPEDLLGADVAGRFGPRLPYLLKLLAADAPLSLQAHPDSDRASAGYAAEEAAGVPRDAPHRRYVDAYHKPELLVAVSEFRALCGFRPPAAAGELLAGLAVPALAPVVAKLRAGELEPAVRLLLEWPASGRAALVAEVVAAAGRAGASAALAVELAARYPADVGVVLALMLNQLTLAPGEAIFMPAGNLHAYLQGVGVELMAASDNVLRGGLTPKYVDVPELLRVLRFRALDAPVRAPVPVAPGVVTWPVPVAEFALHRVRPDPVGGVAVPGSGPRSVLCLSGTVRLDDSVAPVTIQAGQAAFASAATSVTMSGTGEAYVASVPA